MKKSTKEYIVDRTYKASAGLANAVLVTLGIGLLIETLGTFTGWAGFFTIEKVAQLMLAPAIGAGMAYQLGGNTLVIFSAMATATVGAGALILGPDGEWVLTTGQPISATLTALITIWVGKRVTDKTKLDMMAIPFASVFVGGVIGVGLAAVITPFVNTLSEGIANMVSGSPIIGSIIISIIWSIFLMSPASSTAIAIALQLDPVSSAAALIGCTAQYIGWTAMSYRQNELGANIAQCLITPKVQVPNLVRNPWTAVGPFLAAVICAPIAVVMFDFHAPYQIAGIGLNSFIAPLNILANQGFGVLIMYIVVGVLIPAIISAIWMNVLKMKGKAKADDLILVVQ